MLPLSESHSALQDLRAHCESTYPREACGVLVIDAQQQVHCIPGRNLAASPSHFTLDPATLVQCRRRGFEICALYHSHCDAPPTMSAQDRACALVAGRPAWPGVDLIINSVTRGLSTHLAHYQWSTAVGRFLDRRAKPASATT